jgi:hypothetical protein
VSSSGGRAEDTSYEGGMSIIPELYLYPEVSLYETWTEDEKMKEALTFSMIHFMMNVEWSFTPTHRWRTESTIVTA